MKNTTWLWKGIGMLAAGLSLPGIQGCAVRPVNRPNGVGRIQVRQQAQNGPSAVPLEVKGENVRFSGTLGGNRGKATVEKTFKAERVQTLQVQGDVGDIEVEAGKPGVEEVHIRVEKAATGDRPTTDLQPYLEQMETTAVLRGNTLLVESRASGKGLPPGITVTVTRYKITVPKRLQLALKSESGPIHVRGVLGGAEINSSSGEVALEKVGGALNVHAGTGAISLKDSSVADSLRLQASEGAIRAENIHAAGPSLRVDLSTETGSISFSGAAGKLTAQSKSGAIIAETTTTLPLAAASLSSETGAVTLILPRQTSAQVIAHSETGGISLLNSDPQTPDETEANAEDSDLHSQKITLGDGKASVTLESQTGSITVNLR